MHNFKQKCESEAWLTTLNVWYAAMVGMYYDGNCHTYVHRHTYMHSAIYLSACPVGALYSFTHTLLVVQSVNLSLSLSLSVYPFFTNNQVP